MPREYETIEEVAGPTMLVRSVQGVTHDGMGGVELANDERRRCKVLGIDDGNTMVQLYEAAASINLDSSKMHLLGRAMELSVSEGMLSRMFDGMDKLIDGGPDILSEKRMDIGGLPMNPAARSYPEEFTQTDVSVIDGLNTPVRGQRLPIFSASGLPHTSLAVQIARQARVRGTDEPFTVVFIAMGTTFEEASFFMESFRETGVIDRNVMFINLANGPAIECIATPRMALIAAEYLAFKRSMYVPVILTGITNYVDPPREISAVREKIPGHRSYPGYIYTNLASLHERAGRQRGKTGSAIMIPILTMPEDDKAHPVSDLTGYIIEGQITLSRELYRKSMTPLIDVFPPLPHLKGKDIGKSKTRVDHAGVINQLFAAYARNEDARGLTVILGEVALTGMGRLYAKFADGFEKEYVSQGYYMDRGIEGTMEIDWELLCILPRSELKRIKDELPDLYYDAEQPAVREEINITWVQNM